MDPCKSQVFRKTPQRAPALSIALERSERSRLLCPGIVYSWTQQPYPTFTYMIEPKDTPTESEAELVDDLVVAPSFALAADVRSAQEYLGHTRGNATLLAYKDSWKRFVAWAKSRGVEPLPASAEVVSLHLGWLAKEGYSVSTIERFLSAAGYYHRAAHQDFPRTAYVVSETLKGIRHTIGVKRVRKAPLGLELLADACTRLRHGVEGLGETERALRARQVALLTVGWWCTLRGDNLVSIRREHVRLVRRETGLDDAVQPNGLILHLPRSKTDQIQEGRDLGVYAQEDARVCPVRALLDLFEVQPFEPEELIFPISKRTITRLIKKLITNPEHKHSVRNIKDCKACSEAVRRFGSHSLRRGSATTFANEGAPEREIMRHGGWKTEKVARSYMDQGTLFENNPTKNLAKAPQTAPTQAVLVQPSKLKKKRRRARSRWGHRR